jgi:hypothetical protein
MLAAVVWVASAAGALKMHAQAVAAEGAEAKVTIDHNSNDKATKGFLFSRVAAPSIGEAAGNIAYKAGLLLVDGEMDPNGAPLSALTDGVLPTEEDEPEANFFFNAGTPGGRFRMDFGSAVEIAEVRTYSWHPNSRGPQLYRLFGSDGSDPKFCATPKTNVDPASCGWQLIATVDTQAAKGDTGGQYGVSVTGPRGTLGRYRYLLFSCFATEMDDDFGNTFYSEVNVIEKK